MGLSTICTANSVASDNTTSTNSQLLETSASSCWQHNQFPEFNNSTIHIITGSMALLVISRHSTTHGTQHCQPVQQWSTIRADGWA